MQRRGLVRTTAVLVTLAAFLSVQLLGPSNPALAEEEACPERAFPGGEDLEEWLQIFQAIDEGMEPVEEAATNVALAMAAQTPLDEAVIAGAWSITLLTAFNRYTQDFPNAWTAQRELIERMTGTTALSNPAWGKLVGVSGGTATVAALSILAMIWLSHQVASFPPEYRAAVEKDFQDVWGLSEEEAAQRADEMLEQWDSALEPVGSLWPVTARWAGLGGLLSSVAFLSTRCYRNWRGKGKGFEGWKNRNRVHPICLLWSWVYAPAPTPAPAQPNQSAPLSYLFDQSCVDECHITSCPPGFELDTCACKCIAASFPGTIDVTGDDPNDGWDDRDDWITRECKVYVYWS